MINGDCHTPFTGSAQGMWMVTAVSMRWWVSSRAPVTIRRKGTDSFIFKNYHGLVRPLWLGSKLGGILEDFRFKDGLIRSLERTTDGKYVVAEYRWDHFGMAFERFLGKNVTRPAALEIFNHD